MPKLKYIIQKEDVGRGGKYIECCECGKKEYISFYNVMGKVFKEDVGKMFVMVKPGIWQVENDEQFEKRINSLK